jgi:flagellar protein FliO/FliZ
MLIAIKVLLVFALLGGTLWWLRRHDRTSLVSARRGERPVAVLAQTRVGKAATVAVVRIGTETYAIGVTEQSVSLLVPEPVYLPDPDAPAEHAGEGVPVTAVARPGVPPVLAVLAALWRRITGRRDHVEYLDVDLPAPRRPLSDVPAAVPPTGITTSASPAASAAPATDGSVRGHIAGMPEPVQRR